MARQRLHFFVIAALVFLAVGCSSIQESPETPGQKQLRQHVAVLASDGFEGRLPGTPGYERAGSYVAEVMQAAGLQPAAPAYRQKVPLVAIDPESVAGTLKITIGGRDRVLEAPTEVVFAPPRQDLTDGSPLSAAQAAGALVFVGDGIVSPALGLDAYRGVDVRGKIALIATGNGPLEDKAVAVHLRRLDRKRQAAFARGAVGVLYVGTDGRTPKSTLRLRVTHPEGSLTLADGALDPMPVAAIAGSVFADLMKAAGRDADAVLKAVREGKAESFALPATAILSTTASASPVDTFNVVGVLPGTDPQLASEAVVITAHLDHLGRGVSHGHPTPKVSARGKSVDNIYNGALDNAAGTAIVLEAASALAASGPHRRTLIFAAVTAEEAGLLGSAYLARNIEALGYKPVANVNVDMPVLTYPLDSVIGFGEAYSTLDEPLQRAASAVGVEVTPDPVPELSLFVRSDHYRFVERGIPALFLFNGMEGSNGDAFRRFMATHYHQPSDDITLPIRWADAVTLTKLTTELIRDVANADEKPAWNSGSVFAQPLPPSAEAGAVSPRRAGSSGSID